MTSSGIELRIGNKYRVGRKIGSGSFGDIYLGEKRKRKRFFFFFPSQSLCVLLVFVYTARESVRVTKRNASSTFTYACDDG
jgi:serine/threonine protein kinase